MNRKNQLVVIVNMNEKSKVIYPQESDFSSNIKNKSFKIVSSSSLIFGGIYCYYNVDLNISMV